MPRNKYAGTHPSYKALNWSKASIERKKKYDAEYSASPERKKYRTELNRANKKAGTYGKMKSMGMDRSHTKTGALVMEKASTNRARNGRNGGATRK
jgi:hypothetical protein